MLVNLFQIIMLDENLVATHFQGSRKLVEVRNTKKQPQPCFFVLSLVSCDNFDFLTI